MASKETFLDDLRSEYRDDVEMIIVECQSLGKAYLDVEKLNKKLRVLKGDFAGGLSEEDWLELIYELAPEVYDSLDFGIIAA
ncbi:MAG: hypothetical protein WEB87_06250 [Bacteriovoracaceae bacterium]